MDNKEGGFLQWQLDDQARELREKPKVIQDLMRRFPPLCRVTAKGYAVPGEGRIGVVVSWFESGSEVSVQHEEAVAWSLFNDFRGCVDVDRLTVVGYTLPFTPEWIEEALKKKEEDR